MNQMRTWALALVMDLSLTLAPVTSHGGNFDVTPIRLQLESESQVGTLSLRNSGSHPILVQAELMSWSGGSKLKSSRDLLVNPPIFSLGPNKSQVIRVALSPGLKPRKDRESAYRLYLREIPQRLERGDPLLQTALRVGIPVFISPEIKTREVRWEAQETSPGEIRLRAINAGTVHVRFSRLTMGEPTLKPDQQRDVRNYLFPGQSQTWSFRWSGGARVALLAQTDEGTLSAELAVKKK